VEELSWDGVTTNRLVKQVDENTGKKWGRRHGGTGDKLGRKNRPEGNQQDTAGGGRGTTSSIAVNVQPLSTSGVSKKDRKSGDCGENESKRNTGAMPGGKKTVREETSVCFIFSSDYQIRIKYARNRNREKGASGGHVNRSTKSSLAGGVTGRHINSLKAGGGKCTNGRKKKKGKHHRVRQKKLTRKNLRSLARQGPVTHRRNHPL